MRATIVELAAMVWTRGLEEPDPRIRNLVLEAYDLLKQAQEKQVSDVCACGHSREEHVMGTYYCTKGCYTTPEQAEHCMTKLGWEQRPTCGRFTKKEME